MSKEPSSRKGKKEQLRHQPLGKQIEESEKQSNPIKSRQKRSKNQNGDEEVREIETQLSQKILRNARRQVQEEERNLSNNNENNVHKLTPFDKEEEEGVYSEDEEEYYKEEVEEISAEDEAALALFMSKEPAKRQTLQDIILEKIKEHEEGKANGEAVSVPQFSPKVLAVYEGVGDFLSKYKSGKIPKAFKVIPSLEKWEDIVFLTRPEKWSPVALCEATRLFSAVMSPEMAQRFYNLILLPAVRDDIDENGRLNFHLYYAIKKSLFKPAAFFKGIMLPLLDDGCTLKEATIICSVLAKVSVPVLHAAAALLKLSEMEYTGSHSLFLKTLLNKKYALPFKVVDTVVNHFVQFTDDEREMPLLWHQSLLTFVQRYRSDLLPEQKQALYTLIKQQPHYVVTDEIRRELENSVHRGEVDPTKMDLS
eukprot:TRINITY_DN4970_c0_g1_i1.p1 TRINITY_DN4970_c0_g1~~TRINITY_DN4970_c0_g1_i1.p1  ORF type:complete len:443 (+),score=191.82 TRINITY_DN4970_c0_g1_i1:61-1329(+)